MPLVEKIVVNEGIIGLFKMTETLAVLESRYLQLFYVQSSVYSFSHERRKKEWMSIRILIAELIGTEFSISYLDDGRPLIDNEEYRFISISHSSTYASVYLHRNKAVGLDVESLDRNFSFIEKKYLSEKELEQVGGDSVLRAIYWSCKEAIFKWAGREGVDFKTQIRIEKFDLNEATVINAFFMAGQELSIALKFRIFDGHVLVYSI